jgi:DNA-directed RNA polymerase subunit RPC12/RpoP
VPRPAAENKVERARFIAKIHEWRKMLEDSIGGPLARSAMMNEMTLRRLDAEIAVADPKQREPLYKQRDQETKAYQNAVEDLQRMFPEMAVAGRVSFRGVISDLVVGHQDYYGNGDRKLMDKVFTATEIEWLLRAAVQVEARFRFSLNLAIIDCINGLYDPNFRPRLKPRVLKQMDAASKAVLDAGRAASGDKLVDLENGVMPGEGDDFEDFNDADCPHCGGRISSQAKRCPECRRVILWKEQDANEHENQKEETNTAASAGAGAAAAGDGGAGAPGI